MTATKRHPINSGAVWDATDVGPPESWTLELDDSMREGIADAAARIQADKRTLATVTREDLTAEGSPLASVIADALCELRDGRGFVMLRGFPVDVLDAEALELAYFALGLQLGMPVSQDVRGTLLGHVRDEGVPRTSPAIRRYATNERQDFHTDGADIIGLLCLHGARSGGESRIASAATVYNEILRRDPAALEVLYAPMYWDRNDEQNAGEDPYFALPVL
jgi:hypothetical protein